MLHRLFLSTAALLAMCAGTAQAAQKTLTASEGVVEATLTYPDSAEENGTEALPGLKLEISRSAEPFYSQLVSSSRCSGACGLERFGGGPLEVKDLEGNGQPDVVLDLNTGGAHCCTIVQVFAFDPGVIAYAPTERDFGDPRAVYRRKGLGLGFIAAWAADQDVLGHRLLATRTLEREARAHRLRSSEPSTPSGGRFIKKLDRFLEKTGYA